MQVGDFMDDTNLYDVTLFGSANSRYVLKEVYDVLEERGYNAKNQIVGYLITGDPGYISSYKGAREKILELDRVELLAYLVDNFLR